MPSLQMQNCLACWLDCPQDQPSTPQHSWRRDTPFWPSCRDLRQRYPRRSSAPGWETFDPTFSYGPSLPPGAPWWPWLYNLEPDGGCCLSCVLRTYLACLSRSFPQPLWSIPERFFPGFGGRCSCTIKTSPFRVQCLKATGGPCSFSDRNLNRNRDYFHPTPRGGDVILNALASGVPGAAPVLRTLLQAHHVILFLHLAGRGHFRRRFR